MIVKAITVKNFRNYTEARVELSDGVNVFVGDNAQGKTNLLEAVTVASLGRSMRTANDREMIFEGGERARVTADTVKAVANETVELIIDKTVKKRVAINGLPILRLGELMGVLPSVFFSPDELKTIKDSPSERRRFVDVALCQISKGYFYLLKRYNKLLSQRNRLLKKKEESGLLLDQLKIWDEQLAREGGKIVRTRRAYIARLTQSAGEVHSYLTDGAEKLSLEYEGVDGDDSETARINLLNEIEKTKERDLRLGYTTAGPHKDDVAVTIDGRDARKYGSQGQIRTAVLALKLAELALIEEEAGERPVLLLDDVLSELDMSRQSKLMEKVRGYQVIITCTHVDEELREKLGGAKYFRIQNGKVNIDN
ncbi:MAG: DNA replication/repair protein RecF [Firmicutes bacterium]|nr:DNA replication/repair protein RecF [Bacillota bacterium]